MPQSLRLVAYNFVMDAEFAFQDRVHRMGQTKPVTVYRLVVENSIDDAMVAMQDSKSRLNDAVLHSGKAGTEVNERTTCGSCACVCLCCWAC